MYLEEMINAEYSRLNENDILIWQYIQLNKRECCEIAIEDLAQKCCISRTTISRFTQKLGFTGFREFKVHLKMEWEQEQVKTDVLLENVCDNYMKCIQMRQTWRKYVAISIMRNACLHMEQEKPSML